jgi:hypothetical protein
MTRPLVSGVLSLFALTLPALGQPPAGGQAAAEKAVGAKQPAQSQFERWTGTSRANLREMLNQTIPLKDLPETTTLKEAVGVLGGWLANYVPDPPIFFNEAAFRAEDAGTDVLDAPVRSPLSARKMTIASALRFVLEQAPRRNATFLLRAGMVEITTLKAASTKQLLRQKVMARYENVPLDTVLDDFAERTGVSVLVDGRVGDKMKTPVSANLGNDAALEGVLRLLADMAGLQLVVSDDAVYLTSPANARRLRQEAADAGRRGRRPQPPAVPGGEQP